MHQPQAPAPVALYDIKTDASGEAWVVMEYIAGESLADALERCPRGMPAEEAAVWFRGIAAGVQCLHDHGIVHRDLKPGNVFYDEGLVKVGDYGLSKFISYSQRGGQTESVGTVHYMAPEIGKGQYGKEIDIYALGVMLYEMLTGRVPFEGESSQEVLMKHLTASADLGDVAEPCRSVIARALEKDPARRWQSVDEMVQRLLGEAPLPAPAVTLAKAPSAPVAGADDLSRAGEREAMFLADEIEPAADGIVFGPVTEKPGAGRRTAPAPQRVAGQRPAAPVASGGCCGWQTWWKESALSAPLKALIVGGLLLTVLTASPWLSVPMAAMAAIGLVMYYGVRGLVMLLGDPMPPAADLEGEALRRRTRWPRPSWREAARQQLREKPGNQRGMELTGSLLMAAAVAGVVSFMVVVGAGLPLDGATAGWSLFAWVALVAALGAWAILGAAKSWEPHEEDGARRRYMMLLVGLALGAAAYGAHELLMVGHHLEQMSARPLFGHATYEHLYAADGSPKLGAYLIYFAALLAVPRWWRQADPLRPARFSLWSVLVCALWAWLLHLVWPFPQPLGLLLAGAISLAVQLSSPWMNRQDRSQVGIAWQEE